MVFTETGLKGAFIIEPEKFEDSRGFFARVLCTKEFEANGLTGEMVQCNVSFNRKRGTLRGMHYQAHPYKEIKLVRCTKGALYDVIIDLRDGSSTYREWTGVELTEENRKMFYVPEGFAHGYLSLKDETEVFYQVSQFYTPEAEGGVRWDDPLFNIDWPKTESLIISEKDRNWPDYSDK